MWSQLPELEQESWVQTSPSSQETGVEAHPLPGLHESVVHGSPSSHETGA
jgi:hypothetical protein